jgi:chromosome segregation ATPase
LTKHYIYIKKEFMKHILNNLTEQEKRAILEQHSGGMKVMTEKFSKLIESKLGDVKPILSEQAPETQSMQQLRQDQRADIQQKRADIQQKRADIQQTRQDNRAIRQQTRQDNRDIRQQTRQGNRAVRRDARAEQAAVTDIMNLRTEFNTLMTNLEALSRHQNTETYKNFLDLINNTAASLKGFVDSTANAGQAPPSEDFQ